MSKCSLRVTTFTRKSRASLTRVLVHTTRYLKDPDPWDPDSIRFSAHGVPQMSMWNNPDHCGVCGLTNKAGFILQTLLFTTLNCEMLAIAGVSIHNAAAPSFNYIQLVAQTAQAKRLQPTNHQGKPVS